LLLWHLGGHASATEPDPRCEPRTARREDGRVVHWNVADELGGVRYSAPGQHVEVAPGAWVRLFGTADGQAYDRLFVVGDRASRGLHSPTSRSVISAIGATSIAIHDERCMHRLSLYDFQRSNAHPAPTWPSDVRAAVDAIVQICGRCREPRT